MLRRGGGAIRAGGAAAPLAADRRDAPGPAALVGVQDRPDAAVQHHGGHVGAALSDAAGAGARRCRRPPRRAERRRREPEHRPGLYGRSGRAVHRDAEKMALGGLQPGP